MKKSAMFFVGIITILLLCGMVLIGCGEPGDVTSSGGNNQGGNNLSTEGIHVGIIKFAGEAEDLTGGTPILLDSSGKSTLTSMLNDKYVIASQSGTALFYGVHKALANLKSNDTKYPTNLDSVNVVTFTDGLDLSSQGESNFNSIEDKKFSSTAEYASYVKTEIDNRKIASKPITTYSVGVRGGDVTDISGFQTTLQNVATSGTNTNNGKPYWTELVDFNDVQSTFNAIADGLNVVHTNTSFILVTAKLASGIKVRMTFDTSADPTPTEAAASTKYIEGVINLTGQTYTLTNITYAGGITSSAGAGPITGTINGSEVNFTFNSIDRYNPNSDGPKTKQWLKSSDAAEWQINSEYDSDGSSSSTVEKRSSVIYLVLDCSTSLNASNIAKIRTAAIDFINSLYNQYNNGSSGNNGGNNNGGNEEKPGVPTGVTATAESSSSIKVSWNPVSGAEYYVVYSASSSSGTKTRLGEAMNSSFTATDLQADTTYYYYVTAVNDTGTSSYSSPAYATTSSSGNEENPDEPTVPNAPTGVTATVESPSGIKVTWNTVTGATSYNVYYAFSPSESKNIAAWGMTDLSYFTTEVYSGTTYYYYVTAVNDAGESAYSSYASVTTPSSGGTTIPNAPTGVTATAESSSRIKVTWSPVSGAEYYIVYYLMDGDSYFTLLTETIQPSYNHTGLEASTRYTYCVTAVNSAGISDYSETSYATTLSNGTPGYEIKDLSYGVWNQGTIGYEGHYTFALHVTRGTTYYGWLDDQYEGSQTKTADVLLSIMDSEGYELTSMIDSAYYTPYVFTPDFSGTVYIMVSGYNGDTGSFAVAYNTSGIRP